MSEESPWQGTVRWFLGVTGLGTVLAMAAPFNFLPWRKACWLALIFLLAFALVWLGYWWYCKRRKAKSLAGQVSLLGKQVANKFSAGLKELREKSKVLDSDPPWYLVVGIPASGKTTLLCKSGILPPVLNPIRQTKYGDEAGQEGDGGTKGMNFLFAKIAKTKFAVILDTAGRLLTGNTGSGETADDEHDEAWAGFIDQLKQSRGAAPVNGLFLFLPVDFLTEKPKGELEKNAGLIGRKLLELQVGLDLRFPVYIIVSKCDRLTGFREFTERLANEGDQCPDNVAQQIMGWSNPGNLEDQAESEHVTDWVEAVAEAIERRTFSWLRNPPVLEQESGGMVLRKPHDFDYVLALPESLRLMAPRLKLYLKNLFEMDEVTNKPLFFRGIYFTSALRKGPILDELLALALGTKVADLSGDPSGDGSRPKSEGWDAKAFFIEDVFRKKAFLETDLVTDATDTRKLKRKRRIKLFAWTIGACAALLLASFFFITTLARTIKPEVNAWSPADATNLWTSEGYWLPILRKTDDKRWEYTGQTTNAQLQVAMTAEQYQASLVTLTATNYRAPWIFRPVQFLVSDFSRDRKRAQQDLFERSVLRPLVAAAREKMEDDGRDPARAQQLDPNWRTNHAEALITLLRVEADELYPPPQRSEAMYKNHLDSLMRYVLAATNPAPPSLLIAMVAAYPTNLNKKYWPPPGLATGAELPLRQHPALLAGLKTFFENMDNVLNTNRVTLSNCNRIRDLVQQFGQAETNLLNAGEGSTETAASLAKVHEFRVSLDQAAGALPPETVTNVLQSEYARLLKDTKGMEDIQTDRLKNFDYTNALFVGIHAELERHKAELLSTRIKQEQKDFFLQMSNLPVDTGYLDLKDKQRLYQIRDGLYSNSEIRLDLSFEQLLGDAWEHYSTALRSADKARGKVGQYTNWFGQGVKDICERLMESSQSARIQSLLDDYKKHVRSLLRQAEGSSRGGLTNAYHSIFEKLDSDLNKTARNKLKGEFADTLDDLQSYQESVRDRLAKEYSDAQNRELNGILKFPLQLDASEETDFNLSDKKLIYAKQEELGEGGISYFFRGDNTNLSTTLIKKYETIIKIADSLWDENDNPVPVTILLPEQSETFYTKYPYLKIDDGMAENTTTGKEKMLAKLPAKSSLIVKGYLNRDDKDADKGEELLKLAANWAPLRLIADKRYKAKPQPGNSRNWVVRVPVQGADELVLTIGFDKGLVPLDKWRALGD